MNAPSKPPQRFSLHRVRYPARAIAEAKRAGVRAHMPRSGGKALLPSYALLDGHVREATYVSRSIGSLTSSELKPLYDAARQHLAKVRRRTTKAARPLEPGETVIVTRGAFEGLSAVIARIEHKVAVLPMPIGEAKVPIKHLKRT